MKAPTFFVMVSATYCAVLPSDRFTNCSTTSRAWLLTETPELLAV